MTPFLSGKIGLPDGAIVQIQLQKPWLPDAKQRLARGLPACEENCIGPGEPGFFGEGAQVELRNGQFKTERLSLAAGAPLIAGVYKMTVILETGNFSSPIKTIYEGELMVPSK